MSRKFFKTVFRLEVLSEDEPPQCDLEQALEMCDTGPWSGEEHRDDPVELTGPEAAVALLKQASDPSFFQLDEQGNDLKEQS